jgi:hypothetical protein
MAKNPRCCISPEVIAQAQQLRFEQKLSFKAIAGKLGVGRETIARYLYPERNKAFWAKKAAKHRADPRRRLLACAKDRAAKAGFPFNIVLEDLTIPACCPILGIPLRLNTKGFQDSSPTVDRIVPELGYVAGNVAVVSFRANRVKSNGTAEEHEQIAAWIRRNG